MRARPTKSLLLKLLGAFAAALLPVFVMLFWGYHADFRYSIANILKNQVVTAEAVGVQVEETFDAALGLAWAVSNDFAVQSLSREELNAHLTRLINRHAVFDSVGVYDANGMSRGLGSSRRVLDLPDTITDTSYYRSVMGTNGPVISEVVKTGKGASDFGVVAAVPTRNSADQITGVTIVIIRADQLAQKYNDAHFQPGQSISLLDRNGRLVFESRFPFLAFNQLDAYRNFEGIRRALSGIPQQVPEFKDPFARESRIGGFVPTKKYRWAVGVSMPLDIATAPVHANLERFAFGFGISLLLSGVIALLFAKRLTAPLSLLRARAQSLGHGEPYQELSLRTGDELQELAESFNEMACRLQDLLRREQAARATAESATRAKDQFLAVVSHELRTPLTPILATLDLIEGEPGLDPDLAESLQLIRSNVEIEARIINDLLDLSRISRGKFDVRREEVHAHALLQEVGGFFKRDIAAKKLRLEFQFRAKADRLFADPARLQQVFWNLVSNAVKFTPELGQITIRTWNAHEHLFVEVRDTGIGIPAGMLSRIFEPFEQGERALTRRYGGLGLGLSISKTLTEMHGGTISVSSTGRGSAFTVELPLSPHPEPEPVRPKRQIPEQAPAARSSILLVEDNIDSASVLGRLLEKSGYAVTTAHDAQEALGAVRKGHYDLLISDIGLPDVTGWDLLRQVRSITPQIAAIAMSGFGTSEDEKRSREAGFSRHLLKPVDITALRGAIQESLATVKEEREVGSEK